MARLRALSALALFALCSVPAFAQTLQRLTVTQLTLSANQAGPQVEVPFDLIVTAHVNERVKELHNLDLPILSELELLGDSHAIVSDRSGTTYTETIRVVAHHSGTITIAPATLDAVDARDGRPKRYSSNALTLQIGGAIAAVQKTFDVTAVFFTVLRWLAALIVVVLLVAIFTRRRRPATTYAELPKPQPVSTPPAPQRSQAERLRDARVVLAAARTRSTVLQIRTLVRSMVGASDAETLADVLARTGAHDRMMRTLLIALERAAFTHDEDLAAAIVSVLDALDEASA